MDRSLIWCHGRLMAADELRIRSLDRAFEHGLGLFESLRTWNGRPSLLERHRARMQASAQALGLEFDDAQWPDEHAVIAMFAGSHDRRLRITLSGGLSDANGRGATLWMTASPLPTPLKGSGAIAASTLDVVASDLLARHKTLNYWRMRLAHQRALEQGHDEVLCVTPDRLVHQGTRTNIVYVESGSIITPADDGPVLPGIMREVVMEHARRLGLTTRREPTPLERLQDADEAFLTSSVRGIVPLIQVIDRRWPGPGELTRLLWNTILPWLETGKDIT